jgi:hypothetical protein
MTLYELRTYTLQVGKMSEGTKLFQEIGMPLITKRGWDRWQVGFFQADTGTINQRSPGDHRRSIQVRPLCCEFWRQTAA